MRSDWRPVLLLKGFVSWVKGPFHLTCFSGGFVWVKHIKDSSFTFNAFYKAKDNVFFVCFGRAESELDSVYFGARAKVTWTWNEAPRNCHRYLKSYGQWTGETWPWSQHGVNRMPIVSWQLLQSLYLATIQLLQRMDRNRAFIMFLKCILFPCSSKDQTEALFMLGGQVLY